MQNTGKIVAWGLLCGLMAALVGAVIWNGCQQTVPKSPIELDAVRKMLQPAPDVKWVADPVKKGWTKVDAAAVAPGPAVELAEVRPGGIGADGRSYHASAWYRVHGAIDVGGKVQVQGGDGWQSRLADAIRADIARQLEVRAAVDGAAKAAKKGGQ